MKPTKSRAEVLSSAQRAWDDATPPDTPDDPACEGCVRDCHKCGVNAKPADDGDRDEGDMEDRQ